MALVVEGFFIDEGINARSPKSTDPQLDAISAEDLPDQVLAESATLAEAASRVGISTTRLWRKRKRWGLD